MDKKRNLMRNALLIVAVLAVIAAVLLASHLAPSQPDLSGRDLATLPPSESPTATEAPSATDAPSATEAPVTDPAKAYLLVTVGGQIYQPIPLTEEARYTISQGEARKNVIQVTQDSICMESSSCDNQDCVLQGTVTLDNMEGRVFQNMIICMPNDVLLQLFTAEELASALGITVEELHAIK